MTLMEAECDGPECDDSDCKLSYVGMLSLFGMLASSEARFCRCDGILSAGQKTIIRNPQYGEMIRENDVRALLLQLDMLRQQLDSWRNCILLEN